VRRRGKGERLRSRRDRGCAAVGQSRLPRLLRLELAGSRRTRATGPDRLRPPRGSRGRHARRSRRLRPPGPQHPDPSCALESGRRWRMRRHGRHRHQPPRGVGRGYRRRPARRPHDRNADEPPGVRRRGFADERGPARPVRRTCGAHDGEADELGQLRSTAMPSTSRGLGWLCMAAFLEAIWPMRSSRS
jgi:hypothetical protein